MNDDKVIKKIFELEDQINNLGETINQKLKKNTEVNEEMITILKRLDQERIFTSEWVRRIENQVEKNKAEIIKMKESLNIA